MTFLNRILLLPAGSLEYHGTELPADTDTIIAARIAAALSEGMRDEFAGEVVLMPALPYGLSGEHEGMPATSFVSHHAYYDFVLQLIDSFATGRDLCVVLNGHGGNASTLASVESDYNYSHRQSKVFVPQLYPTPVKQLSDTLFGEFDAHAGSVEASLIAYYLSTKKREYEVPLPKRVRGSLRFFRTIELTPDGVIKQLPTVVADPELGESVHQLMIKELKDSIFRLIKDIEPVLSSIGE